jgi:hypothetical protein
MQAQPVFMKNRKGRKQAAKVVKALRHVERSFRQRGEADRRRAWKNRRWISVPQ